MQESGISGKNLKALNPKSVLIPLLVSVFVVALLFLNVQDMDFKEIFYKLNEARIIWIFMAVMVLLLRDLAYIYRIRYLTQKQLSWKSSIYTILLWEFASTVTPSVVGGTAVAVYILNKESIPLGRSVAYVSLSAILDNSFFIIGSAAALLLVSYEQLIPQIDMQLPFLGGLYSLQYIFYVSAFLIALYTIFMIVSIFFNPQWIKQLFVFCTKNRFLKRFRPAAQRNGDEMINSSKILKRQTTSYWIKAIISTLLIWSARYFMLNCIIAAFSANEIDIFEHIVVFARQVVMWVMMLLSPTPGSSGTSEFFFDIFFNEFFIVAGLSIFIAVLWRLLTYYTYLIIGLIVLPKWIRKIQLKNEQTKNNH